MHVKVKLYSTLVPYVPDTKPGIPFEVEINEGSILADLINRLKLPQKETKASFVNGSARPLNYRLKNNDEVGIFPPIGGG